MFTRFEGNFWYKLEYYTTGRNDYTAGKCNFCRILENDALMKSSRERVRTTVPTLKTPHFFKCF